MMDGLEGDSMNDRVVDQDDSYLQMSAHETIDDLEGLPEATTDPASMNKEMLRKIKRKERTKLNRKRKKALQRSLTQVNAAELQQSVAALATTIGINTCSLVNDPIAGFPQKTQMAQNFGISENATDDQGPQLSFNEMSESLGLNNTGLETPLCILDASNFNARLANADLAYISDHLDRQMFKDLTLVSKLKIDNIYLSSSKRVWVICKGFTTVNWVTRTVNKMPPLNGRKYAIHTLAELEVMTEVSVLVPKECSLVNNYNDLMVYLSLQNPGLGRGITTVDLKKRVTAERAMAELVNEDDSNNAVVTEEVQNEFTGDEALSTSKSDPLDHVNGFGGTHSSSSTNFDGISPSKQASGIRFARGSSCGSFEVEKQPAATRSRTYMFYADDTWLLELHRLGCRPYLGARRLLCVIGERLVQRSQDGALSAAAKKKRRGGRRPTGSLAGQRGGKTESESGQDSAGPAMAKTDQTVTLE